MKWPVRPDISLISAKYIFKLISEQEITEEGNLFKLKNFSEVIQSYEGYRDKYVLKNITH